MATSPRDKPASQRSDVFISYSRKDRDFVKRLEAELQNRGREAWVDWEGIRPAEEFMQAIFPAIEGTDTFIFVISPDSVISEICGRELAHAAAHNKRMIPIFAREVDIKAIPEALAKLNWVFFCRENDNFDVGTELLISALDTDLGWVRAHTRLLTRAIEWEGKAKSNSFVLRGEDLRAAEQWLAQAGTEKERQPTALQTEYIIASRKAAARRQRITLGAVSFGLVVAMVLFVVAMFARREAKKQEAQAKTTSVQADFDLALRYRESSESVDPRVFAHLARAIRTMPEHRLPRQLLVSLLRDRAWCIPRIAPLSHGKPIRTASLSTDGQRIISVGVEFDNSVRLWDAAGGKMLGELPSSVEKRRIVVIPSPDCRRVFIGGLDGHAAQMWDVQTGKPVGEPMPHDFAVESASFTPDARRLVTASKNGFGRVWDAETGKPVSEFFKDEDSFNDRADAAISADGRWIALLNYNDSGTVWDVQSGKRVGKSDFRHAERILAITFSPDGHRLATASRDKTARIWNVETGEPIGEPIKHGDEVVSVCFSPDGRRLATASYDKTARVWDAETAKPVSDFLHHDSKIVAVSFSPDGSCVLTASEDKTARVWDSETGKMLREPLRHESELVAARFSTDGDSILTASVDGSIRIWDAGSGQAVDLILRHNSTLFEASFSADGRRILTAPTDNTARLWDAESGRPIGETLIKVGNLVVPRFSADGRRVVIGAEENSARIWDAETGKPASNLLPHGNHLKHAVFGPGDRFVATACWSGMVKLWDPESGKLIREPLPKSGIRSITGFSADGAFVITRSEDGVQNVRTTETGQAVGKGIHPLADGSSSSIDISADHRRLAIASDNDTAQMWDIESGETVGAIMRHEDDVRLVSFGPGDKLILTASRDWTARVWDASTGQPVSEPMRHRDGVETARFSPDGTRVVTASLDNTTRLWDAETGKALGEPVLHKERVISASFSPDGRRMVTASWDKTAIVR
ncbi:MAG TPA: TIR domain-containing protein, partial [Chthoniobacterales bacterium]|nr:TIR domain-containing protein [Chthoniobacterales bacterium]